MKPLEPLEVWFVTGSQDLYGEAPSRRSRTIREQIARALEMPRRSRCASWPSRC